MNQIRPPWNELEAITRVLTIAELAHCSIHIAHVSLADAVQIVQIYKERYNKKQISCEITAHHFCLNSKMY